MLVGEAVRASVVIAGATAIGKTALALSLVRAVPGRFEIVSADSIQVYQRFDIGSAKPSSIERAEAAFHLIDFVEPDVDFTLVDYVAAASAALRDIVSRGKVPLIVGGTGLYIRALTAGLGIPLAGPDESLRGQLTLEAQNYGAPALHRRLAEVDSDAASRIHRNDLKRIIRALEVYTLSGRPLSQWRKEDEARERTAPRRYIALDRNREKLYRAIDKRVDAMYSSGIVEETEALRAEGYSAELKPMTSVGYLQANQMIDGKISRPEAIELTKNATHQYARRQLIWFRGEPVTDWINLEDKTVEEVLNSLVETT